MGTTNATMAEQVAVGYCRVSTADQANEGVSLDAQRARIAAWCDANGYRLAAVHVDAGISGKRADNRPALQAAINETCRVKGALVSYSLSRISRSVRDTLDIASRLERGGADLVSLSERIDTTSASGRMVFKMLAVLAEFERELVAERTSAAMRLKQSRQEFIGGDAPFGFRVVDGHLVEDAAEQAIIREARALRSAGLSLRGVSARLADRGFVTRTGRPFLAVQVQRMTTC